ncbi:MAG TPA: hypothetical protein PK504_07295 [Ferruginibacter sp.]|nr:hypothetical protein [Ferruginibacter sp.]HRE64099.1 hypothetical protein [Ferruginibacter sp.]
MFLKQLYQYNKYWVAVFLCFLFFFFYINYKWGVVATPVYQYGMFSGKYRIKDTVTIYKIILDDKELKPAKIHFTTKDMLFTMLEKYENYKASPMQVYKTMQAVVSKFGLSNVVSADKYKQNLRDSLFTKWLLEYFKSGASKVQIIHQKYLWQQNNLKAVLPEQNTSIEIYR